MTLNPETLIRNKTYRVQYKAPRSTQEFVAKYLGLGGPDGQQLQFNARPHHGTITVRKSDIVAMWETNAPIRHYPMPTEVRVF